MNSNELRGLLVPVLTPFLPDLMPSTEAFLTHCRWLLDHGADGLAVFGTTSEANSLGLDERIELLDALAGSGIAVDRIMPGTGTCTLTDTVRLTRHAVEQGCAGVLMLPPFYYKGVSDEGLFASFSHVIDQVGDSALRIYLYHIPPMSSIAFSLPLIERLCKSYPSVVVGIKDSGGDWAYTASILEHFPHLAVFPGSESFLLEGLRHGGAGCITASGNVNPGGIRELISRWQEADAGQRQAQITAVRKIIQSYPMIPALKTVLAEHYAEPGWLRVRPPLCQLDPADAARLLHDLDQAGFRMSEG